MTDKDVIRLISTKMETINKIIASHHDKLARDAANGSSLRGIQKTIGDIQYYTGEYWALYNLRADLLNAGRE